ncbi:hypothetical protein [Zhihengliuella halotolerans]|uniref:Permease family protein n=1 Tax=Zhihengliuella halotolerans TaxID=370736 RepID=A0A4Q8AE70_9MICC|nr:hypothetical protein [Zhihengliuella halotolerans]RZU62577.1 hypothetical protein EV380_2175 [Zhihengliuella halotolerans]
MSQNTHIPEARSPHWKAGPFAIRLPFVHYRFEWQDYTQGLLMCAVDLAAIPLLQELLGMPFEAALAIVALNGLLYLLHHLLGDPVVPGWITPAIPLIMLYIMAFPEDQRVHALIAFQLLFGLFSVVLGITGLAQRIVLFIPHALRAGIVVGAGIAAVQSVFAAGGRFESFPWTISIAVGLAFLLLYSKQFQRLQTRSRAAAFIGNLGILPCILVAVVVAPLAGEAAWPSIETGFSSPDFVTMFTEYTVFGVGLPPLMMFVTAVPTVLAAYVVVFGDVLQAKAVLKEASDVRPDEAVVYNPDRAHLIFGARNALMSIIGPDTTMCGPLWAAMHVTTTERYKKGPQAMPSIFGGAGWFRWGTNTGLWLLPVISFVEPILGVALALTLLIQGFVSIKVGILEARSRTDLGIAGVTAAVLATNGASWGFVAGILLCLLVYGSRFFTGEDDGLFRAEGAPVSGIAGTDATAGGSGPEPGGAGARRPMEAPE